MTIIDVIEPNSISLKDARVTRGEAITFNIKQNIDINNALQVIINDLKQFMSKATGKLYTHSRESYSNSYRISEPGRISYGIKVSEDNLRITIQAIAILEDITILKRYYQRIKKLTES